jgi:hypothetical protein
MHRYIVPRSTPGPPSHIGLVAAARPQRLMQHHTRECSVNAGLARVRESNGRKRRAARHAGGSGTVSHFNRCSVQFLTGANNAAAARRARAVAPGLRIVAQRYAAAPSPAREGRVVIGVPLRHSGAGHPMVAAVRRCSAAAIFPPSRSQRRQRLLFLRGVLRACVVADLFEQINRPGCPEREILP